MVFFVHPLPPCPSFNRPPSSLRSRRWKEQVRTDFIKEYPGASSLDRVTQGTVDEFFHVRRRGAAVYVQLGEMNVAKLAHVPEKGRFAAARFPLHGMRRDEATTPVISSRRLKDLGSQGPPCHGMRRTMMIEGKPLSTRE